MTSKPTDIFFQLIRVANSLITENTGKERNTQIISTCKCYSIASIVNLDDDALRRGLISLNFISKLRDNIIQGNGDVLEFDRVNAKYGKIFDVFENNGYDDDCDEYEEYELIKRKIPFDPNIHFRKWLVRLQGRGIIK